MSNNELVWKLFKVGALVVVLIVAAMSLNTYVKTKAKLKSEIIQMETARQVEEIEQEAKTARTQERTDKWTHSFQKAVPWGKYDDEVESE
jgi:CHASE3 domain sensor protein